MINEQCISNTNYLQLMETCSVNLQCELFLQSFHMCLRKTCIFSNFEIQTSLSDHLIILGNCVKFRKRLYYSFANQAC